MSTVRILWLICGFLVYHFVGLPDAKAQSKSSITPPTVLSLVVSAKDKAHLDHALRRLEWVVRNRNVQAGNVFIVGDAHEIPEISEEQAEALRQKKNGVLDPGRMAFGEKYRYLQQAGVPDARRLLADRVLDRLNISASPTWVVRYRGADYVFEGYRDPVPLFNKQGEFLRGN